MKYFIYLFLFFLPVAFLGVACTGTGVTEGKVKAYPYRWLYYSTGLRSDNNVEDLRQVAKTASEHGLNGILLSAGLDQMDLQNEDYFRRLEEVKKFCKDYGLEIIPSIFSVGYSGSLRAHNKNLAAGIPVNGALFIVSGSKAEFKADPAVKVVNGSFEDYEGNRAAGYDYEGEPGQVIFIDNQVVRDGKTSLRFENFDQYPEEAGRMSQEIAVRPHRCYSMSVWIKSEGMDPSKPFSSGNLQVLAFGPDGHQLEWININAPSSGDWFKAQLGFNSLGYDKVKISIGTGEGKSGKFWIDDLQVREAGLLNVLRRPGTPVTVRGEKNGTIYEEGRDYAPVEDPGLNCRFDHEGPSITILPGSRIKNGERLRVDYYHCITVYDGQVTACMSEPEVYDIWRTAARLIHERLAPKTYFLHMDEIRAGGTCKACQDRGMSMAQILGDCITRQVGLIREVDPDAEVCIWSDMIDPNHNASTRRPYYYHVNETYDGSWNYVPKDLIIACWWYEMRDKSLKHFSDLGFRTIGASYYDADDLENPRDWLASLDATPGAVGIIYTTWLRKYALLADFGDLVSRRK